jgi:hypothetical protein
MTLWLPLLCVTGASATTHATGVGKRASATRRTYVYVILVLSVSQFASSAQPAGRPVQMPSLVSRQIPVTPGPRPLKQRRVISTRRTRRITAIVTCPPLKRRNMSTLQRANGVPIIETSTFPQSVLVTSQRSKCASFVSITTAAKSHIPSSATSTCTR